MASKKGRPARTPGDLAHSTACEGADPVTKDAKLRPGQSSCSQLFARAAKVVGGNRSCRPGALEGRKRPLDLLELELQTVGSCRLRCWEQSLEEQQCSNQEAISQPPHQCFS